MKLMRLIVLITMLWIPALVSAKTFEIYTGEWPPYVSKNMDGYGPTAIIVEKAIQAAGHEALIKFAPWKRAEVSVQEGRVIASFPWSIYDTFEETCYISSPITSQSVVFFYMKDTMNSWDYTGLDDLKKYNVGGCPGYAYIELLEKAGISIDFANTIELSMKKLIAHRVDVLPESLLVGKSVIQQVAPEMVESVGIAETPFYSKPLHLMISKNHPDGQELYDAFEKGFAIIKENGTYQSIIDQYELPK